jgi:hypothetical protein
MGEKAMENKKARDLIMEKLKIEIFEKRDEASLDIYSNMYMSQCFPIFDYYSRIFGICKLLNITHLYDIGCRTIGAAFLLSDYNSATYIGIDCHKPYIDFNNTHMFDLLTEIYGERIKFQEGEYPFAINPVESNVAISCYAIGFGKPNENEQTIKNTAATLSGDFERIIINVNHEYLEKWKSELTDFEIYKIGETSSTTFIFGTKFSEDVAKLKKQYKLIDNEFMTGIGYNLL